MGASEIELAVRRQKLDLQIRRASREIGEDRGQKQQAERVGRGDADLARKRGPAAMDEPVDRADRALLGAKADGRNQVTIGPQAA